MNGLSQTEVKMLLLENNITILRSLIEKQSMLLIEAQNDLDILLEVMEETLTERDAEIFGMPVMEFLESLAAADPHEPDNYVMDCYSPITDNHWTQCNCEDYPCCGH